MYKYDKLIEKLTGEGADTPPTPPTPAAATQPPARPLTVMKIAWAVFLGNLMTGLLAAVLYSITR